MAAAKWMYTEVSICDITVQWVYSPLTTNLLSNDNKLKIIAILAFWGDGHTLFIKYVQLTILGHVKGAGRGAYAHTAKKTYFYKRL